MKFKLFLMSILVVGLLAACGSDDTTSSEENNDEAKTEETDAVTAASHAQDSAGFVSAVGENGTWIIYTTEDLTVDEDVVVAGTFHDKGDEANDVYRKIAPYAQDADHNITDSFTITVPKLTVQSENLKIQGGIIAGDVIVEANGFSLDASATIEGNLYFASEDVQATAAIDGKVTGNTEVASAEGEADAVTAASHAQDSAGFVNAVGENGTWIIYTTEDLTVDEDVVVAGTFHDKGDEANDVYRKIAPYAQDADHNITDSFTITVPKLTVQSDNLKIQGGIIAGDVIVEANGFSLDASATIEGNLYFANEDVKAAATIDGEVTGATEVQ
ncbi:hypothetical protein NC661_11320 [Aquibacillus koreensis]|uniref:Lipoprotein n=1 Tax=Aquibacillus koreensis TaxID=279446 RepID=A0A9X3WPA5_9BACI|nr:hypothetical protein [Aquibacillus koreensis]MCT2537694.1 hypothetical protein [Aquibacillus koreensis]MDC3420959.1 hypothetical protein [Aquibacillus koreensis]